MTRLRDLRERVNELFEARPGDAQTLWMVADPETMRVVAEFRTERDAWRHTLWLDWAEGTMLEEDVDDLMQAYEDQDPDFFADNPWIVVEYDTKHITTARLKFMKD